MTLISKLIKKKGERAPTTKLRIGSLSPHRPYGNEKGHLEPLYTTLGHRGETDGWRKNAERQHGFKKREELKSEATLNR